MDEFLGTIKAFGFNFAPRGWALCQGQLINIASNTALFSLLGTYYGGNGTTTFGLPDLRGRTAIGQGQGPGLSNYTIGQQSGTEKVTLLGGNLPPLTATSVLNAESAAADKIGPGGKFLAQAISTDGGTFIYSAPGGTVVAMAPGAVTTTIAPAGSSQPVSILNPSLTINYSVCLQGIFPSRN